MSPWLAAALGLFIGVNVGIALMAALQIHRLKHSKIEEVNE